ncbi:MAG TPA: hypothetical protein VHK06_02265 [Candidatus Limnocylindria bacterium]|nr:hypothetical protein [Candidatus Limnocylindria bacterium]
MGAAVVIVVELRVEGQERPPAGSPVRVELRDTSYADAPAVTLASGTGRVADDGDALARVELEVDRVPDGTTVWAHVDVDGDGRVSSGDFITMASWPVAQRVEARLPVGVRRV